MGVGRTFLPGGLVVSTETRVRKIYVENGNGDPTDVVALLKACAKQKDLLKGTRLHSKILKSGILEKYHHVGSTLVSMYAKCGALAKARRVHDELRVRDGVTWNALIAGYAQQGQGDEALKCFDRMQQEGHSPDVITFICILKACGRIRAAVKGEQIHNEVVKQGLLEKSTVLGNALLDMYVKCGALAKAQRVLGELPVRDAVSWNTLIAGYAQQGQGEEALQCFDQMQHNGHSPDAVTFSCILKACGSIKAADKGEQIHDKVVKQGLFDKDLLLGTALLDMYVKCGALAKAQQVFDELSVRNVILWNVLIAGYAQQWQGEEALKCFDRMQHEGHSPDAVTFTCILKACGSVGAADKGEEIHQEVVRRGLLEKNIVLGTALLDMHVKCGALAKAQQVLDELGVRDAVSWTVLIEGFSQQGQGEEALKCFDRMQCEGHSPDTVTFACALKACGSTGAADKGGQIHDEVLKQGLLEENIVLGNALLDMYVKCGMLAKAQKVLDELPVRDLVSWNVLITGYAQQGQGEEALQCFDLMQSEGHLPDEVTFICILKACSIIGATDKGEHIYDEVVRQGLFEKSIVLGNALLDMHVKCGALAKAQCIFDELPIRNLVSWNILIAGYAQQGQGEEALKCFNRMQQEGLSPDAGTLVCILNACSHSGLMDEGQMYFAEMSTKCGLAPNAEHHCCMVDLFGRAGEFKKALAVIEKMQRSDYLPVWHALLGACRKWRNVKVGELAFEHAVHVDKNDSAAYVSMANIYAAARMQTKLKL